MVLSVVTPATTLKLERRERCLRLAETTTFVGESSPILLTSAIHVGKSDRSDTLLSQSLFREMNPGFVACLLAIAYPLRQFLLCPGDSLVRFFFASLHLLRHSVRSFYFCRRPTYLSSQQICRSVGLDSSRSLAVLLRVVVWVCGWKVLVSTSRLFKIRFQKTVTKVQSRGNLFILLPHSVQLSRQTDVLLRAAIFSSGKPAVAGDVLDVSPGSFDPVCISLQAILSTIIPLFC